LPIPTSFGVKSEGIFYQKTKDFKNYGKSSFHFSSKKRDAPTASIERGGGKASFCRRQKIGLPSAIFEG